MPMRQSESRIITASCFGRHVRGGKLPCRLPVAFEGGLYSKLGIVLEEATNHYFGLSSCSTESLSPARSTSARETNELVSIFVASLRTVKGLKSEI